MLKPLSDRTLSAEQIARDLRRKVSGITGVNVFVTNPPSLRIGGRSSRSSYQYTLQGVDLDQLQRVATELEDEAADDAGLRRREQRLRPRGAVASRSRSTATAPRRSASRPQTIEAAMGYAFGGQQVSQIYASNDQYQVILELLPELQRDAGLR